METIGRQPDLVLAFKNMYDYKHLWSFWILGEMREQRRVKWHLNLRRHPSKQHGPGGAGRIKKIVKSIAQKSCRKTITLPRYSLSTPRAQNLEMCNKPFWQLKWSQMCSCICRWVFGFKTGCKLRCSFPSPLCFPFFSILDPLRPCSH